MIELLDAIREALVEEHHAVFRSPGWLPENWGRGCCNQACIGWITSTTTIVSDTQTQGGCTIIDTGCAVLQREHIVTEVHPELSQCKIDDLVRNPPPVTIFELAQTGHPL